MGLIRKQSTGENIRTHGRFWNWRRKQISWC